MIASLLRRFFGGERRGAFQSATTKTAVKARRQLKRDVHSVSELVMKAMDFVEAKPPDYAQAAQWFEEAWLAQQEDVDIRLNLAEALFHTGGKRMEEAIPHFQALAARAPRPSRAAFFYFRLGQCCFELHRFEEAADWFGKVPRDHDLKPQAERAAIHCEMAQKALTEEAPSWETIVRLIPLLEQQIEVLRRNPILEQEHSRKLAQLHVECGGLHAKLVRPGDQASPHWERAVECFRAALDVEKDFALAFYCEGLLWTCAPHLEQPSEHEMTRAKNLLKLALELDWSVGLRRGQYPFEPETEERFLHIAEVFTEMGFVGRAEKYLDKSICTAGKVKAADNYYMQRAREAHSGGIVSPGRKRLLSALHSYLKISELDRSRADFAPRYFLRRGEVHELLQRPALAHSDYQHALLRASASDEVVRKWPLTQRESKACREGMSRMADAKVSKRFPVLRKLPKIGRITPVELDTAFNHTVIFRQTLSGWASGSFISQDGFIITCAHGLASLSTPTVSYFHHRADDSLVSLELEAVVLKVDHGHDLALMKVEPRSEPFRFFALAESDALPGTRTVLYGHPARSVVNSSLPGDRPAYFHESRGRVRSNGTTTLRNDARSYPGFSGGPVIDLDSALMVGVHLASSVGDKEGIAANISILRRFLQT